MEETRAEQAYRALDGWLHRMWSAAVGTKGYRKQDWREGERHVLMLLQAARASEAAALTPEVSKALIELSEALKPTDGMWRLTGILACGCDPVGNELDDGHESAHAAKLGHGLVRRDTYPVEPPLGKVYCACGWASASTAVATTRHDWRKHVVATSLGESLPGHVIEYEGEPAVRCSCGWGHGSSQGAYSVALWRRHLDSMRELTRIELPATEAHPHGMVYPAGTASGGLVPASMQHVPGCVYIDQEFSREAECPSCKGRGLVEQAGSSQVCELCHGQPFFETLNVTLSIDADPSIAALIGLAVARSLNVEGFKGKTPTVSGQECGTRSGEADEDPTEQAP